MLPQVTPVSVRERNQFCLEQRAPSLSVLCALTVSFAAFIMALL